MVNEAREPYRCVFIDWHNTLSYSLFWEHRPELAPLARAMFSVSGAQRALLEPWMRGTLTSEQVVRALAQATGIDYEQALGELIVSCQGMAVPQAVLEAVASLRAQGLTVVIATDNMDTFRRWTVPSLRLEQHFDAILCSAEIKALKYDGAVSGQSLFFQGFLDREGIGPGESVLLDDGKEAQAIIEGSGIDYYQIASPAGLLTALWYLDPSSRAEDPQDEVAAWKAIRKAATARLLRRQ